MLRHVARLAAMTLVVTAASLAVPDLAGAATCGSAHGVTVVVDFHQLGGGVRSFCDAGGAGAYAAKQFSDAGYTLTRVSSEPGFVCRVDGTPSSDPCVRTPPTNAYWSLWWSDGTSGTWKYSSSGVDSLKVPDGGSVALSWQGQRTQAKPRVAPPDHASSSPSPTSSPTSAPPRPTHHPVHHAPAGPTAAPSSHAASVAPAPSETPSGPSSSVTRSAHGSGHASGHGSLHASTSTTHRPSHRPPQVSASPLAGGAGSRATPPVSTGSTSGSGLPGWLAPSLVVLVFLAGGLVTVVRRRRSGGV